MANPKENKLVKSKMHASINSPKNANEAEFLAQREGQSWLTKGTWKMQLTVPSTQATRVLSHGSYYM